MQFWGSGTVTGPYYYLEGETYSLSASCLMGSTRQGDPYPRAAGHQALLSINEKKFEAISRRHKSVSTKPILRQELLVDGGSATNPTKDFYDENKADFESEVEEPFKRLMSSVASVLPSPMLKWLETEKRIFAKIPKNDYGRGGAWPWYWGAFYPKGGKRIRDAQLFLSIKHDRLQLGFYFGEYGEAQRLEFARKLKANRGALVTMLSEPLDSERFDSEQWTRKAPIYSVNRGRSLNGSIRFKTSRSGSRNQSHPMRY